MYFYFYFLFFLFQQFITRSVVADHGSYIVTMYRTSKLHEKRERKWKKRKTKLQKSKKIKTRIKANYKVDSKLAK